MTNTGWFLKCSPSWRIASKATEFAPFLFNKDLNNTSRHLIVINNLNFSIPSNVGARMVGNPKNFATAFDKPSTSRNLRSRVRDPNLTEGQGHLEKCTQSMTVSDWRRKDSLKGANSVTSLDPKIKCFEVASPCRIVHSEMKSKVGFMMSKERTFVFHSRRRMDDVRFREF